MATQVIKRDGSLQPFDENKLKNSIRTAAQDAAFVPERVEELTNQISAVVMQKAGSKDQVSSQELREAILMELDKVEPAVAAAWRRHETEGKGLTD